MLHLLLAYAEQANLAAAPGFKRDFVRWLLRFDSAGHYVGAIRRGDEKGKGDLFRLPRLSQPEMKAGGAGTRHFLCDSAEVVVLLGVDEGSDPDLKLIAKHEFFVSLLRKAAGAVPVLNPISDELSSTAVLERIRGDLMGRDVSAKTTDNVTLAVEGEHGGILLESDAWHDWYAGFRGTLAKNASGRSMISLAAGGIVTPAKTHGAIRGLAGVGGIAMGDALSSFKQEAFRHYGLEQSENAAVSDEEAAGYRTALDALIRDRSRGLAGSKIVYWYAGPAAAVLIDDDDPLQSLLPMAGPGESEDAVIDAEDDQVPTPAEQAELHRQADKQACNRVRKLLDSVRAGERPDLVATRFYALSLSANSGRVVVRDWMQGEFPDLAASVLQWMQDLSVVRLDSPHVPDLAPKLESIVTCVLPPRPRGQKYDDWVKPVGKLREPLWRAAVGMRRSQNVGPSPVPDDAIGMLLPRWRAAILNGQFDDALNGHRLHRGMLYARASLLKAYLVRNGVNMESCLFEDHPSPAYQCGRLLAVLADLQKTALGDVGAGVVQRYYARASTAPADAIGPLIRLSHAHLDKIKDKGLADHLQGRIAQIFGKLCEEGLPATLNAVGQSLFAMGFYQQIARMRHERLANTAKKREREQSGVVAAVASEEGD